MRKIFADTFYWAALLNPKDQWHEAAKDAPAKYRGIGVRIEDDVLVTEDGNVNLTAKVPKQAEEIEELMNSK